ncbi:EndoU domain-containing protein [Kibdelosporangium lantanae]|uniref:EndoU domain-containing protein n=1 Tax=Kibdelosporangium lantanae TaxID=1497396 RepID=A0ABW3M6J0_9PSEU
MCKRHIPDHAWDHIFKGEMKDSGKVVGYHHREGGMDRHGWRTTGKTQPDANGVYRGTVTRRDWNGNTWVEKRAESTFFPDDWSQAKVQHGVERAFKETTDIDPQTGKWTGSYRGVKISGYYDPETGDSLGWLVDEEQQAVVREIVDKCLEGKPMTAIARVLNERGVPCPRDRRWDVRLIRKLVAEHAHPKEWARLLARMESDECRELAEKVVARVLAGEAPKNVGRELNRAKVPYVFPTLWDCNKVKKIALSKAAAGLRVLHKQVVMTTKVDEEGQKVSIPVAVTWDKIVQPDEHATLAARLSQKERGKQRDGERVKYWWSGIAMCGECDGPLTRSSSTPEGRYQCRKKGCVSRDQLKVDAWLMEQALLLLERPDAEQVFRIKQSASKADEAAKVVKTIRAELEEWRNSASAGRVSPQSFAAIEPGLLERLARAEARLDRATVPAILTAVIGPNAREVMAQLDIVQVRTVLRTIMRPRVHRTRRRMVNGLDTDSIDPGFLFAPQPAPVDGTDAAA